MNFNEWMVAKGPYGRPLNPRLVAAAMGKAMPTGARSRRQAAAGRRLRYEVARLTAPDVTSVQHGRAYRRARYAAAVAAQPVTTIRVSDYGKGYAFATERARAQRLAALRRHW